MRNIEEEEHRFPRSIDKNEVVEVANESTPEEPVETEDEENVETDEILDEGNIDDLDMAEGEIDIDAEVDLDIEELELEESESL
ncbi:MAG: hypothetical protein ACK5LC_10305 [Coprobacillaceae bacterium]